VTTPAGTSLSAAARAALLGRGARHGTSMIVATASPAASATSATTAHPSEVTGRPFLDLSSALLGQPLLGTCRTNEKYDVQRPIRGSRKPRDLLARVSRS